MQLGNLLGLTLGGAVKLRVQAHQLRGALYLRLGLSGHQAHAPRLALAGVRCGENRRLRLVAVLGGAQVSLCVLGQRARARVQRKQLRSVCANKWLRVLRPAVWSVPLNQTCKTNKVLWLGKKNENKRKCFNFVSTM